MDSDVLEYMDVCKNIDKKGHACHWWYDTLGKCRKPSDLDCPKDVRQPQQNKADADEEVYDF